MQCTVITTSKSSGVGEGLTYEVSGQKVCAGMSVSVPLRKSIVEGIVMEVHADQKIEYDIKSVHEVFGDDRLLSGAQLSVTRSIAEYYCTSLSAALRVFLPPSPWRNLLPHMIRAYRLGKNVVVRGTKRQLVVDELTGHDAVPETALRRNTGVTRKTLEALVTSGALEAIDAPEFSPDKSDPLLLSSVSLSPAQRSVSDAIASSKLPSLLFGITGSGKTEVYAELLRQTIRNGKSAIILVPEIFLSEQTIRIFRSVLNPESIAVIHSKLTPSVRKSEWRRIRFGGIRLVIGSRSALFSPVQNLGLIILDEEHEWTYKNEQTPKYHARTVAEMLCAATGAKLVLGSATPSIESWHMVKNGSYTLARLPDRHSGMPLPKVSVVDLATVKFGPSYPFSRTLLTAIEHRLKRKEQTVLFLNRRGLATALLCLTCRKKILSPDSAQPLTVHAGQGRSYLQDHTTGRIMDMPARCPSCNGTDLRSIGAGTERIETLLKTHFPTARVLRADADTLLKPDDIRDVLSAMEERRADILLGTQCVIKGLDLPGVTLAAVLVADVGLSLPHFRAGERIFDLVTQLIGRSGRAVPGEVIIQTFRPESSEIKRAVFHQTEAYLDDESALRRTAGYPPFSAMIRVLYRGNEASLRAKAFRDALLALPDAPKNKISASPTLSGGGKEWHVLLRGQTPRTLLTKTDLQGGIVDIDPIECL